MAAAVPSFSFPLGHQNLPSFFVSFFFLLWCCCQLVVVVVVPVFFLSFFFFFVFFKHSCWKMFKSLGLLATGYLGGIATTVVYPVEDILSTLGLGDSPFTPPGDRVNHSQQSYSKQRGSPAPGDADRVPGGSRGWGGGAKDAGRAQKGSSNDRTDEENIEEDARRGVVRALSEALEALVKPGRRPAPAEVVVPAVKDRDLNYSYTDVVPGPRIPRRLTPWGLAEERKNE